MNEETATTDAAERYELEDEPFPHALPIRADLFALYGPGLLTLSGPEAGETPTFDAWLHVGENGRVTLGAGKAEVGQNARTSLTQAVADELPIALEAITIVLADTDVTPFDMGTFGSRTTPFMVPPVRRAAAAARETLLSLAAEAWKINRARLTAHSGCIVQASTGITREYGELVRGRRLIRIAPPDLAPTPAAEWTVAGTSPPKVNGHAFVTGRHAYTSDCFADEMLYGKVLRPPAFGATLKHLDTSQASAMPGVTVVHEGGFVGVAAPTVLDAARALASISAEWDCVTRENAGQTLDALLRPVPTSFSVPPELPGGGHRLSATYTLAFIAHVPLEPRAALAKWDGGKLTVWTGTQRPFGVREELTAAFGVLEENVRVIVPDTGSGYGGKHTGDAAVEAARLARAAGKPVKLVWTREEEFCAAYLRPAGILDVCAATNEDATITHWEFHNYNSGGSALRSPYRIPGQQIEFHEADSPLRQGSYRALAATGNHFARESHMDELAHAHQIDPLTFRLQNLDDDRLRDVLIAAAERFGWNKRKPVPGHGFGIAGGTEKESYVANCVEIMVKDGAVKICRIVAAYECGAVIHPKHLESQVEGATVMGIGGALFEEIKFDSGRILNPRLSEYRVPRFGDVPEIDIVLLDRKDLPSVGAGETPIVAIAAALGNAIFDATGIRPRSLPMVPNGLKLGTDYSQAL